QRAGQRSRTVLLNEADRSGGPKRERNMTKKPASVYERLANLLCASDRGHKLQRHGDLAHQFALVAPLGGGAIVALQALPEIDDNSPMGAHPRSGRVPVEVPWL